jgi:hypothetical protein
LSSDKATKGTNEKTKNDKIKTAKTTFKRWAKVGKRLGFLIPKGLVFNI